MTQLFRYIITGASSFLLDFLLLFILEAAGMHYLPAAAWFLYRRHGLQLPAHQVFRFKSINATVGPAGGGAGVLRHLCGGAAADGSC